MCMHVYNTHSITCPIRLFSPLIPLLYCYRCWSLELAPHRHPGRAHQLPRPRLTRGSCLGDQRVQGWCVHDLVSTSTTTGYTAHIHTCIPLIYLLSSTSSYTNIHLHSIHTPNIYIHTDTMPSSMKPSVPRSGSSSQVASQ